MTEEPRDNEFERIAPVDLVASRGDHNKPLTARSRHALPAALVGALFAILLLVLAGVFFYLPRTIEPPDLADREAGADSAGQEEASSRPSKPEEDIAPWQQALIARERQEAQDILGDLLSKQFDLEEQAVERWAADAFAAAKARAETGDELFRSHDYQAAAVEYTAGNRAMDDLLARVDSELAAALERGEAALANRNQAAATEAFDLALAIEPENPRATRGLERAASLDEVLALMQSANAHEEGGRLEEAVADYRKAVELDGEFAEAREAVSRVESRLAEAQFNESMSAGFAALQRDDYAAAREAFTRAERLKPSAPGPADGLAQVELNVRLGQITAHRRKAEALEAEERWREAAGEYEAALEIDPDIAFAKAGLRRTRARAELSERLQYYLDSPERLYAENVHANATALLRQVSLIPERGPRLERQIVQLEGLLRQAVTPVRVRLESDNQTQVVVHKVGTLGTFESRELELPPGTYTIVGTCDGYRDVRREVEIAAGEPPAPVEVRCEEKI